MEGVVKVMSKYVTEGGRNTSDKSVIELTKEVNLTDLIKFI